MSIRFLLASLLVRIGFFFKVLHQGIASVIGSSILILSKPEDLEALIRQSYRRKEALETWGGIRNRTDGLSEAESHFVTKYLKGKKRCLVLGCGGGRELIALAKLGFEVTGIDSSRELVESAKEHARALSLNCTFEVGDVSHLPQSMEKYDALFMSALMYSLIPTRKRRIAFLKKAQTLLKDDGSFYLEFSVREGRRGDDWKFFVKKWLVRLCGGNRDLEKGDVILTGHYVHHFNKESEFLAEIEESGFRVIELDFSKIYAVLIPAIPEPSHITSPELLSP